MVTIAINSTFTHLNQDRTLSVKQNCASREREAIVDITFSNSDTYTTNGFTLDFSKIRNFKEVYFLDPVHNSYGLPVQFIPSAGNVSSTGKLKFFDDTGAELGSGSSAIQNVVIRAVIRGI